MRKLLIICLIAFLIISPVAAKEVTATVDDKGLVSYGNAAVVVTGTLHTQYGWISVRDADYNVIEINDTIRYNTDMPFWNNFWDVEVIK